MTEIRCVKCKRLLFRIGGTELPGPQSIIEVKCPKCHYMNTITTKERFVRPILQNDGDEELLIAGIITQV